MPARVLLPPGWMVALPQIRWTAVTGISVSSRQRPGFSPLLEVILPDLCSGKAASFALVPGQLLSQTQGFSTAADIWAGQTNSKGSISFPQSCCPEISTVCIAEVKQAQ